jgi:photosystem II stability/assembly factor-like uncharacterized protein
MKILFSYFSLCLISLLILTIKSDAQWVQTNGPYGGQINSLVSIGSYIFTCAGGTVLYSTNNGTAWNATGLTNGSVGTIANEGNKLIAIGSEIFISVDEGVHWSLTGSSVPWINLQVLAASNTALFVSANDGLVSHLGYSLYRSTDDGANWTSVSSGLANAGVNAIAFNGDANIYAGTNSGVYISTNNGGSWKSAGLENTNILAISVISNGIGGTSIFAAARSGVFHSTNGGASWSSVNAGLSDTVVTALSVYPKATGTPVILAGTQGGRVFLSNNNGDNWTDVSNGLIVGPWEWGDWEAYVRSLAVVGSNFFACTNAGLFLSTDNGGDWEPADDGIINSLTINALAVYCTESGSSIFAGSFPSGVFLSTDNGSHWGAVNNGINSIDINALTITGKNIFAGGPTGVFLSTNNGTSWATVGLSNTGEVVSLLSATDAKGDILILAGTWSGLFISPDNGKTWDNTGLEWDITALTWSPNGQGGINIFAGTRGSGVFLSTDDGVTWSSLHNGIPVIENISALIFRGKNLFAATDYVLYVSADDGASWSPTGLNTSTISSNTWIYSLAVDTNGTNGLDVFAGTNDHGVLLSKDGGATWAAANAGLTDLCIYSLAVSDSYLFAGTNVSGVWKRPLSELTAIHEPSPGKVPQIFSLYQNYPNPFNPSTNISFNVPSRSFVSLKVFNLLGKEVASIVSEILSTGNYTRQWNAARMPSGVYFYRLQAGSFTETKKLLLLR